MKIVIFSYNSVYSGSERILSTLLNSGNFHAFGDIKVFVPSNRRYLERLEEDIIDTSCIKPILLLTGLFFKQRYRNMSRSLSILGSLFYYSRLGAFYNFWVFLAIMLKEKPDILHVNNGGIPGFRDSAMLLFIADLLGVRRKVVQFHNRPEKLSVMQLFVLRNCVDLFFCHSNRNRDLLLESTGSQVVAFPSYYRADVCENAPTQLEKLKFISIGLLEPRKGHLSVLKAIKKLYAESLINEANFHYYLIGDGALRLDFECFVEENELDPIVSIMGYRDDYNQWMKESHVFLHTSDEREDLPLILLEAISQGIPIMSVWHGGIADWFDKSSFITLDSNDLTHSLFDEIKNVIQNKVILEEYKKRIKNEFSEKLSEENYITNVLECYE